MVPCMTALFRYLNLSSVRWFFNFFLSCCTFWYLFWFISDRAFCSCESDRCHYLRLSKAAREAQWRNGDGQDNHFPGSILLRRPDIYKYSRVRNRSEEH